MENPIKMDDLGGTAIFGNIHMGIKINNDKDPYFNEPGFPMERIGPGIFFSVAKKCRRAACPSQDPMGSCSTGPVAGGSAAFGEVSETCFFLA